MPQDNSIPNSIWGGPSPVDSFIQGRNAALDYKAKKQTMDRNQVLAGRQDEQYDYEKNARAIDQLGAILDKVPDGDARSFEQAKAFAVQNRLIDAQSASQYSVTDLPRIRALSQQARALAKERMAEEGVSFDRDMRTKAFGLDQAQFGEVQRHNRAGEAIASTAAAARGAAPPKGFVPGPPDAEGNPTYIPKINDEQAKATGFSSRLQSANAKIDQFTPALLDWRQAAAGSVPFGIGNTLVSSKYQQADQAVRDFINAQLRRESGAVISDSEFDNANRQYIPQVGDRKEVLAQKKEARALAFRNMRTSSGPGASQIEAPPANAVPKGKITKQQYDALPSGTPYTAPDGSQRVKP